MTENKLLIGSLSNDLVRVANLSYRGSRGGAQKFWEQAKRWIVELKNQKNKTYIEKIISDLEQINFDANNLAQAEKNLMYGVLLANYSLGID